MSRIISRRKGLSLRKYPQLSKYQCKNNIGLGKNYFIDYFIIQSLILSVGKALENNMKELIKIFHFVPLLWLNKRQVLQEGLQKTDFVGIRLPDKVEDKGLLAVTKIVIKSLKPQDSKQFDDNIYLKEVYNKLVN